MKWEGGGEARILRRDDSEIDFRPLCRSRSSMAGLRVPLSTLHPPCYHDRRMTQGRDGPLSPFPYGSFIRYSLPALTGAFSDPFAAPTPLLVRDGEDLQIETADGYWLVQPGDWVCVGGLSGLGVYSPAVFEKDFQVVGSVCGTSTSASDCVLAVDKLESSEQTDRSRTKRRQLRLTGIKDPDRKTCQDWKTCQEPFRG